MEEIDIIDKKHIYIGNWDNNLFMCSKLQDISLQVKLRCFSITTLKLTKLDIIDEKHIHTGNWDNN